MCYPITPQRLSFNLTSAHIEDVQWVSIAVMADIFYNTNYKMIIEHSTKNDKRLMAIFGKRPNGTEYIVHFGSPSPPSEAFIDHGDKKKRTDYIKRHRPRENWKNPYSPGALSRYILWGETTDIDKNIRQYKKRFWEYQL